MILNFGHTLGHAIEAYYHYETYTHGCAVAAGMCLMTDYTGDADTAARLRACVERYGLPSRVAAPIGELVPLCGHDKKRAGSHLRYIVCEPVGHAVIRDATLEGFAALFERTV